MKKQKAKLSKRVDESIALVDKLKKNLKKIRKAYLKSKPIPKSHAR